MPDYLDKIKIAHFSKMPSFTTPHHVDSFPAAFARMNELHAV
jgi:hypothetical protein